MKKSKCDYIFYDLLSKSYYCNAPSKYSRNCTWLMRDTYAEVKVLFEDNKSYVPEIYNLCALGFNLENSFKNQKKIEDYLE